MSESEKFRGKAKFDETDKIIIICLSEGMTVKEVACKINLKPYEVRNRINAIRIASHARNSNHLISMFHMRLLNFVT